MREIWKNIEGYAGVYQVSNLGRIKSISRVIQRNKKGSFESRTRYFNNNVNSNGYLNITLNKNKKSKILLAHRIVANTFIPNPLKKTQVNHINGIKTDNRVENLEWATPRENIKHAIKTGLVKVKMVHCVELDKTFKSGSEASLVLGINQSSISRVCNGKRKTAGGMSFIFVE